MRVLAEAQGMTRRGHEVWIGAPAESRIYREAAQRGLPAAALPIGRKSWTGFRALRRCIERLDPHIVNSHSSTDTWLAALTGLGRNHPPLVRTRHISAPIPQNPATRWLYRRATARVVTTGEALRIQVIEQTGTDPGRVCSVPTGIDLDVFKPGDRHAARSRLGLPIDAFTVGIVATLRSWKGHVHLVRAMAQVREVHLVIVGDGPLGEHIARQVEQSGLTARVTLAGHQADVVPWMHSLDVLALPSYANEGVPQAIMQAMACGLPVITTAAGGIGEIACDGVNALVVPMRDANAIAAAIARIKESPALRVRLGEAGLARAKAEFSIERMLDRMEAVFSRAISETVS